jgi:hypothetical protein
MAVAKCRAARPRAAAAEIERMDRRRFLGHATEGAAALALGRWLIRPAWAGDFDPGGFARPPLAGACTFPETAAEETLAAVLDTVVPGPAEDPTGAPGALDACAMNLLLDDYYPFRQYVEVVAALVDSLGQEKHGAQFAALPLEQRVSVLVDAEKLLPVLRLAYRAIRSAFYGGAYNGVGLDWLGYPGPNLGYRHVAAAVAGKPVCKEMTTKGWMP